MSQASSSIVRMEPHPLHPVLTVVIPCFNERETIRELVRRVREQPIADTEIIVVDDGSQDGTRDLLPGFATSSVPAFCCSRSTGGRVPP